MFIKIQKKQVMDNKKGAVKRSKQIFVLNSAKKQKLNHSLESYAPFSNLALCPKHVIGFVQNPSFDFDELQCIITNLKMPTFAKRSETLSKMRKIADKQEAFKNYLLQRQNMDPQFNSIDTMSQNSDKSQSEQSMSSSFPTQVNRMQQQPMYIDYNNTPFYEQPFKVSSPVREIQINNQDNLYIEPSSPKNVYAYYDFHPVSLGFEQQNSDFNQFLNF